MVQHAIVDTTVLYAAGNRTAQRHDRGFSIVKAADSGELPILRVPDPVLIETVNGLVRDVGYDVALDFLQRLRTSSQFEICRESARVWSGGIELFEQYDHLSLADASIVESARNHSTEYLYSFDDDFDGIEGLHVLTGPENPFVP